MKKVSIIIPIYNQENYLHKSIDSALQQSYPEIEIVCVNDGSTDNSLSILKDYQKENHIIIFNQDNSGLIHAVTQGVKQCTGDYICFLDPDDYLGHDYVQKAINEIGNHDFVAFGHYIDNGHCIRENNIDIQESFVLGKDELQYIKNNLIWDSKNNRLSKIILNSRWNKLYKATIIKELIEEYDNHKLISFGEDTLFTYLLVSKCNSGIAIPTVNEYYYNTGNQFSMMSNSSITNHVNKAYQSFEEFKHMLENNNDNTFQAYALYYFLIESLFQRLEYHDSIDEFGELYLLLHEDVTYIKALNQLIIHSNGKRRIVYLLRRIINKPVIYRFLLSINNRNAL